MVYWPLISKPELTARQERLAREEQERLALDAITTDKVICGEQQPESDHFVKMEQSNAGDDEGIHWRETREWFSYQMKTHGQQPAKVRIQFRPEHRRDARVYVNDTEIGTLTNQRVAEFEIPTELRTAEVLTIKVGKGEGRITPHIYEVRLVK